MFGSRPAAKRTTSATTVDPSARVATRWSPTRSTRSVPTPSLVPTPIRSSSDLHRRSDLAVHRGEDPVEQVEDGHFHAESGEGGGELDTHWPGSYDEQAVRYAVHPEHLR